MKQSATDIMTEAVKLINDLGFENHAKETWTWEELGVLSMKLHRLATIVEAAQVIEYEV